MNQHKSKDIKHDLIIVITSFILVTVGGSFLTYYWQHKELKNQLQIEQKKYEREAATKVFEEVSKQLDRQISNFQLLLYDQTFKQKCQEDYLDWNENKTRLRALGEKYFGTSASESLTYFDEQLKSIFLENKDQNIKMSASTNSRLNDLEIKIRNFNLQLVDDLLRENIGSSREKLKNSFETELKP